MIATLCALAALAGVAPAQQLSLAVNAKDGDTLSGEFTFVATVTARTPVRSVEFYVGDELRATDESQPYEFKLDTISESEGPLTVSFAVFTTDAQTTRRSVRVTIDNQVGRGAQFHVDRANAYLTESKWDLAIQAALVAQKADRGFNPARLALARAYFGKGEMDRAQKFAEDALAADEKLTEANQLLAGINVTRAFNTFDRGGNQRETLETIASSLKTAVEQRRRVLDQAVDGFGAVTDENRLRYADVLLRAHRYSAVVQTLSPVFRRDTAQVALGNRIAYAQLRSGRYEDALATLNELRRRNALDAYSQALLAIVELQRGNPTESDAAMREAVLNDAEDLGVRTAQAFIALKRGRNDVFARFATDLARDESQRSEVQYYLAILANDAREFEPARTAFRRAILAEPANYDMFVQRGNEALAIVVGGRVNAEQNAYQIDVARRFFDIALAARADSAEALTGLSLAAAMARNLPDALRFARSAASAAPNYPAGHFALSMAASARETELRAAAERIRQQSRDGSLSSDQRAEMSRLVAEADRLLAESQAATQTAGRLDPSQLGGRGVPTPPQLFQYFSRHGRLPLLIPPR